MSKFANLHTKPADEFLRTAEQVIYNHEQDLAYKANPLSELFMRLVTSFIEDKYYESASQQLKEIRKLVHMAIDQDPDAVRAMTKWARHEGNMRSVPIVVACEYAAYQGPHSRDLINDVCVRGDEPAELLGYWLGTFGKPIPSRVKRGLSDAAQRLYTERNSLRWDSPNNSVRMADVIELCHVKPNSQRQALLFRRLIEKRHNREELTPVNGTVAQQYLPTINVHQTLMDLPQDKRKDVPTSLLIDAQMSWEQYSSYINGPMDAEAWEKVIPLMGYMALLRNLRNFEEANISEELVELVSNKLSNPNEVRKSRQLPFRFWSAMKNVTSYQYLPSLERALDTVFENVPNLKGSTLILLDTSGSMGQNLSARGSITPMELGSVFAAALAYSCDRYNLVQFAEGNASIDIEGLTIARGINTINSQIGQVGHATRMFAALTEWYQGQDRVIILSDLQAQDSNVVESASFIDNVPLYYWDLSGYGDVPTRIGDKHFLFSGINDKVFDMIGNIENSQRGVMPWSEK